MEDTGRPVPMGRGRGRARESSPTRTNIAERRSPTRSRSRSPDRGSTSTSSGDSVDRGLEKLALQTSTSSSSSSGGSAIPTLPDDSTLGTTQRGAKRGFRTDVDHVTTQPEVKDEKGTLISMKSNPYDVKTAPPRALYEYRVDMLPESDRTAVKKTLFKKAIAAADMRFGYVFDGIMLYTPELLGKKEAPFTLEVEDTVEKIQRQVILKLVSVLDSESPTYVIIYNQLFRKCMFALGLLEIGRNFFDPEAAIHLPAHRLILWPGYVTSIRLHEDKMLLGVESTNKVLHMDSVLFMIKNLERTSGTNRDAFRKAVKKELSNTIVMTTYNKMTYHVEDVCFDITPASTFELRKDEKKTLVDYYSSRYGITIEDLNQPLLKAKPNKRNAGRNDIHLVPELCQSTGLTDKMRANVTLMKELSQYPEKELRPKGFFNRLRENPMINAELLKWGMVLDEKLVELKGRINKFTPNFC